MRKPSSYCLRTRRSMVDYSRIFGEAPIRIMNPFVMVVDWISWFWKLQRLELCFVDSPRVFGIYRAKRQCGRSSWWAEPTWAYLGLPSGTSLAHWVSSGPEKISEKLCCVWTPFGVGFPRFKKQAKNINWHWALCQCVSPKK